MSTTTKCPHCGAEESPRFRPARASWIEYECGTGRRSQNEPRSSHCYERQIAALQSELDKRQWQPIETAPLDNPLQLGWWESYPEKKWVQEVESAGHSNDKGPGMSNAWLHGRATHWQPLPEPPKE